MTNTSTIMEEAASDLEAMRNGAAVAREHAQAAYGATEEIVRRMAATGLTGMIAGLTGVRQAIGEVVGQIERGQAGISQASNHVALAPAQASARETLQELNPVDTVLAEAATTLHGAAGHAAEVATMTQRVLDGGNPGGLVNRLNTVREVLVQVAQRAEPIRQRIQAVITTARNAEQAAAAQS